MKLDEPRALPPRNKNPFWTWRRNLHRALSQEIPDQSGKARKKASALYKGAVAALASLGATLLSLGYALAFGLINLTIQCLGNRPCLQTPPNTAGLALVLYGPFLMLLSLLIWRMRNKVSSTAHGPFGPPIDQVVQ